MHSALLSEEQTIFRSEIDQDNVKSIKYNKYLFYAFLVITANAWFLADSTFENSA